MVLWLAPRFGMHPFLHCSLSKSARGVVPGFQPFPCSVRNEESTGAHLLPKSWMYPISESGKFGMLREACAGHLHRCGASDTQCGSNCHTFTQTWCCCWAGPSAQRGVSVLCPQKHSMLSIQPMVLDEGPHTCPSHTECICATPQAHDCALRVCGPGSGKHTMHLKPVVRSHARSAHLCVNTSDLLG